MIDCSEQSNLSDTQRNVLTTHVFKLNQTILSHLSSIFPCFFLSSLSGSLPFPTFSPFPRQSLVSLSIYLKHHVINFAQSPKSLPPTTHNKSESLGNDPLQFAWCCKEIVSVAGLSFSGGFHIRGHGLTFLLGWPQEQLKFIYIQRRNGQANGS